MAADFLTTQWSLVLRAGSGAGGDGALADLCRLYWQPLFHFARLQGLEFEDARDAVQDFFADLLQGNYLARADAAKGRFRSFLIGSFRHQMRDTWQKGQALKRGGRAVLLPMDRLPEVADVPAAGMTPEEMYDRQWAMTVLNTAAERLRLEMEAEGHGQRLEVLEPFLSGSAPGISYAEAAGALRVDADRVRTWIFRLRQRRGRMIRAVVAETLEDTAEVDDELRHLLSVMGGAG